MQNLTWRNKAAFFDVINLLLAACLVLAPWIFKFTDVALASRNAWVCGTAIGLAAIAAIVTYSEWEEWASLLLGLWLVISPWVLGFHATALSAMRVDVAIGIAVAVFAAGRLWLMRHTPPRVTA